MDSLPPFLWGSFIPYNMPVYPGAFPVKSSCRKLTIRWHPIHPFCPESPMAHRGHFSPRPPLFASSVHVTDPILLARALESSHHTCFIAKRLLISPIRLTLIIGPLIIAPTISGTERFYHRRFSNDQNVSRPETLATSARFSGPDRLAGARHSDRQRRHFRGCLCGQDWQCRARRTERRW